MATETWAIAMVRDEADIVAHTVRRMAAQVDRVLIADNGSTDGTRELLEEIPAVEVLDDPEPGYYQSAKLTALAQRARLAGAGWVVPFDADEVWHARPGGRIADALAQLPSDVLVAHAELFDHVATHVDQVVDDPVMTMGWRRPGPAPLPKVACRAREDLTIAQGNHAARYDVTPFPLTVANLLVVRHFPYRSVDQVVRKVRNGAGAYAATDLPAELGAHWRSWGAILETHGEQAIAELFHTWHYREDPAAAVTIEGEHQPPLVYDPCP